MSGSKQPVSLEDLIRLKKAERPAAEFWVEFDRQLRAKQLSALVAKKPWWHGLRGSMAVRGKYQLPIAAAAVVAITFISFRGPSVGPADHSGGASNPVAKGVAGVSTRDAAVSPPVVGLANAADITGISLVAAEDASLAEQASRGTHTTSFLVSTLPASAPDNATPSARFIAANLAAVQESMGPTLMPERTGFESRALPRTAAVDPLQQMALPGESRRTSRFVTAMVASAAEEPSLRTTERVASRISPDELYDQVRRIGTRRGGLNVKF